MIYNIIFKKLMKQLYLVNYITTELSIISKTEELLNQSVHTFYIGSESWKGDSGNKEIIG